MSYTGATESKRARQLLSSATHRRILRVIMSRVSPSAPELVNPVPAEEIAGWSRAMANTYLVDPDGPDEQRHIDAFARKW